MAFKNILPPNVASGTDFKKTIEGFSKNNGNETLSSSIEQLYKGKRSLKVTTTGTVSYEGSTIYPSVNVTYGQSYTGQFQILAPLNAQMMFMICGTSKTFVGSGTWQKIVSTKTASSTTTPFVCVTTSPQSISFYINELMIQAGTVADPWEFPGVDLTGNSIPANTNVNNVKLENIIKAFGIESQEKVNNLTLQNILTLTNIPSEEYVNNIELLNEIILEAIENTTSVNDAVIYIKCNYLNLRFEMKYPSTSFKMKQPHTDFKMKYP